MKLILLILLVIVTGSIQHISVPILVTIYPSLYFILVFTSLHGLINFFIVLNIYSCVKKIPLTKPKEIKLIGLAGIINALMSISFVYSSNPQRTPILVQSIFLGLAILPTVLLRRLILNRKTVYDWKWTGSSLVFLFSSIIVSISPLFSEGLAGFSPWILLYIFAIFLLGLDNVLQENYAVKTNDFSIFNKLRFATGTSFFQLITLILLCWLDPILGYNSETIDDIVQSLKMFAQNPIYLELFIINCLILYVMLIQVNEISSNYNMILTTIMNQSVAIFFTLFPSFNNGLAFPIKITLTSLVLSGISVFLWIKGERNYDPDVDII